MTELIVTLFVLLSLRLRDIRKADLWDGLAITACDYLDGSYRWTLSDGSYRWGRDYDEYARIAISRPVPSGFIDWSDDVFKDACPVYARMSDNDTWDASATTGNAQSDGTHTYTPVYVKGYYGDYLLENWPGVGPSPAQYTMKAMLRDDGKICHPDSDGRKYGTYAKPIVHSSDWSLPFVSQLGK